MGLTGTLLITCAVIAMTSSAGVDDIIKTRCHSADPCFPSQVDLSDLARSLTGRLIIPSDEEYKKAIHVENEYFKRFPSIVVMAHTTKDIQTSVQFARKFNLHVAIKSSGHDLLGRCTWESSFMINLSELKGIEVKPSTQRSETGEITVGTGSSWQEIYQALDGTRRVVVGGAVGTVSPGGFTLGGGFSVLSRSLGLAVDNVLQMQVVLSDGRVATCTKEATVIEDEVVDKGDLFWALTGGGGATFGIVSYFTYKLHLEPDSMVHMGAMFPLRVDDSQDVGEDIMNKFHLMAKRLPSEYHAYAVISNGPFTSKEESQLEYDYTGTILFSVLKFGPWSADTLSHIKELESVNPELRLWWEATNVTSFWEYQKDAMGEDPSRMYTVNSLVQRSSFSTNLTDFLLDSMFKGNDKNYQVTCSHTLLGGKISEVDDIATAVHPGCRTALSSLSCAVNMLGSTPDDRWSVAQADPERIKFGKELGKQIRTFGFGEYLNEPDLSNDYWIRDYWDTKYPRLLKTKFRYDPDNFFTCKHCVGSNIVSPKEASVPFLYTELIIAVTVALVVLAATVTMAKRMLFS